MALKDDGVNIINGINYGAFTEALNNKVDRNLANLDNDGQAILDEKMDIDFTNISAIGQAVLDKKVEIEALLEENGYAKFSWKDGNKISNLIICWGSSVFLAGGTTITFPHSFSNVGYQLITGCGQDITTRNSYSIGITESVQDRQIAKFTAHGWNASGVYDITSSYIAIGN